MRFRLASRLPAVLLLVLAIGIPAGAVLQGADWPEWRGPARTGVSGETGLPAAWSPAGQNLAWKAPYGSRSAPVVFGDRLFMQTTAGSGPTLQERLICFHADTGKLLWEQTAFEGPVFDARHERSSFAAPTAATDGQMVFAYFGPEGLYGYDFSGELVWKSLVRFPTLGLGTGTSPVLFKDLAIIQRDEDEGRNSAIVAYDKQKGTEIWKTKRAIQISWSTPVLVEAGRRTALVTNGTELVIACDPATGKELWQTNGVDSNAIHTPLVGHGLVIMTADYPAKKVIAIRPGDVSEDKRVAWEYSKGTGYVLSNILYGDYLYLLTDNGIVTCLDPKTGVVKYEGGRVPVPARFRGSPVAFADSVAMTSEDGDTFMLKAGPAHEIARTNSVDEPVYSSPAIANGRIYIRGQKHLFAIGPKA
ncbi:MAG: PQQ-like beta-propeller repeat protein [Acidobacteria bacterium]|nr:PQQ-like beta-propeller repeat protein [Acidobacteriota bacterium]